MLAATLFCNFNQLLRYLNESVWLKEKRISRAFDSEICSHFRDERFSLLLVRQTKHPFSFSWFSKQCNTVFPSLHNTNYEQNARYQIILSFLHFLGIQRLSVALLRRTSMGRYQRVSQCFLCNHCTNTGLVLRLG